MELVADVQNTLALGGQLIEDHKEFINGLRGQDRSGFVKNQQLRIVQQRANDLDSLHLPNA